MAYIRWYADIGDLQPLQIGQAEITKLRKFGIHTVRKLLQTPTRNLLKISGFSQAKVDKVKAAALKLDNGRCCQRFALQLPHSLGLPASAFVGLRSLGVWPFNLHHSQWLNVSYQGRRCSCCIQWDLQPLTWSCSGRRSTPSASRRAAATSTRCWAVASTARCGIVRISLCRGADQPSLVPRGGDIPLSPRNA